MRFSLRSLILLATLFVVAGCHRSVVPQTHEGHSNARPPAGLASASSHDGNASAAASIRDGNANDFAVRIEASPASDLPEIAAAIADAYRDDPVATRAWLTSLTDELGRRSAHRPAARLINALSVREDLADRPEIAELERGVYARWIQQDSDGILRLFREWTDADAPPERPVSVVASLYQREYDERFENYLRWIEETDPPLQGLLIQQLVPHLQPQHFNPVEALILDNLDNGPLELALYDLSERRADQDPAEALRHIAQIEVAREKLGIKVEAFGLVIRHMARHDLDAAHALIKQPGFIATYFPTARVRMTDAAGDWSNLAHWFHDETLRHFIEVLIETDPGRAKKEAESFFNYHLRQEYR